MATTMGDLMREQRLLERFDRPRVNHILLLWERVVAGFNQILTQSNSRVYWECEEVTVPFDRVEDAQLIFLLSAGAHPTDANGNDILFLLIAGTITQYNNYAEKLEAFASKEGVITPETESLDPRSIVRGFGGAVKVGSVNPLPKRQLDWVAECSWDQNRQMFDEGKMEALLRDMINLFDRPVRIANPLDRLRERFCFREESALLIGNAQSTVSIKECEHGNCYANSQDFQLVDEVQSLVGSIGFHTRDEQIRRTLMDNFHSLDYESIRAVLEGCRTFLDQLSATGKDFFETVGSGLDELLHSSDYSSNSTDLELIGFPKMSDAQSRLLLSLDVYQFLELIHYAVYQLASEAYLYANLPMHMTDPLTADIEMEVTHKLGALVNGNGVEGVVAAIDEFVRDVLCFYETQLIAGANLSNPSLKAFLTENNFCDAADVVFAALPPELKVRNYVSLRQRLHQIKLSILARSGTFTSDLTSGNDDDAINTALRGRCWLLGDDSEWDADVEKSAVDAVSTNHSPGLWFEQALLDEGSVDMTKPAVDAEMTDVAQADCSYNDDIAMEGETDVLVGACVDDTVTAAVRMQRWWRYWRQRLDHVDLMVEDEPEQDHGLVSMDVTYGTVDDEVRMRQWLDAHLLPQSMADALLALGARTVNDIVMLVQDVPETLTSFAVLDRVKLTRAVASVGNVAP
jgi:hypothetical protein